MFEQKIQQVEDEMCKVACISRQELTSMQEEMAAKFNRDESAEEEEENKTYFKWIEPHPRLLKIIHGVLQEYGIASNLLYVYATPENHPSINHGGIAGIFCGRYLLLNEDLLKFCSDHYVRAVIAHEAQHVIFEDNQRIAGLLGFGDVATQKLLEPYRNKLVLLTEMRADVFAALKSPYYALAMEHLFKRYRYNEQWVKRLQLFCEDITHPTDEQRIRVAQIISQQLKQFPQEKIDPKIKSLRVEMNSYYLLGWLRHEGRYFIPIYVQQVKVQGLDKLRKLKSWLLPKKGQLAHQNS